VTKYISHLILLKHNKNIRQFEMLNIFVGKIRFEMSFIGLSQNRIRIPIAQLKEKIILPILTDPRLSMETEPLMKQL